MAAKDQKQSKNENAGNKDDSAQLDDQKQSKNENASGEQITNDTPIGEGTSLGGALPNDGSETHLPPPEKSADEIASELEDAELDSKRPLCEPSLRKGLKKLATYKVWRHNGTVELCSIEEVGPGSSHKKAIPL